MAPRHYHVELRRNGAPFGSAGPYARRKDAEADVAALGTAAGMEGRVVACGCATRRNAAPAAAAAVATLAPIVLPYLARWGKAKIAGYLAASPEERVAMLRKVVKLNLAARAALANDALAARLAETLAGYLREHGDLAVDAAVDAAAQQAARANRRRRSR